MKTLRVGIFVFLVLFFLSATAWANRCMRYDGHRVCPGDSVFELVVQFGEPLYKDEVGEIRGRIGGRNITLWFYEFGAWRYELQVVNGRVMTIKRIRLKRSW